MVTIEIEKRRGKRVIVAREKGKYVVSRIWKRNFNLSHARRIYKSNNTFDKDLSARQLVSRPNMREYINSNLSLKHKPKNVPFRVVTTGILKSGFVIAGSSQSMNWDNIITPTEKADESFFERLAQHFNKMYDADAGLQLITKVKSITHELIFVK